MAKKLKENDRPEIHPRDPQNLREKPAPKKRPQENRKKSPRQKSRGKKSRPKKGRP